MSLNFSSPLLLTHVMESGRHVGICKNAASLSNMFVMPTVHSTPLAGTSPRMALSLSVYFELIGPFSPERARAL